MWRSMGVSFTSGGILQGPVGSAHACRGLFMWGAHSRQGLFDSGSLAGGNKLPGRALVQHARRARRSLGGAALVLWLTLG